MQALEESERISGGPVYWVCESCGTTICEKAIFDWTAILRHLKTCKADGFVLKVHRWY